MNWAVELRGEQVFVESNIWLNGYDEADIVLRIGGNYRGLKFVDAAVVNVNVEVDGRTQPQ